MLRLCITFILIGLLAGCATSPGPGYLGTEAAKKGNIQEAERLLKQAISEGEIQAWNNLGVVYERSGRPELATRAYQMGARYGHTTAQMNLIAKGLPVPPADLAGTTTKNERDNAGWEALFKGINDGMSNQQTRKPLFCDSTAGRGRTVQTTCY